MVTWLHWCFTCLLCGYSYSIFNSSCFFITPFLDSLPGNFYYTWCSYRTQQCNEYGIYTGIALLLVATLAILYVRHKKISVPLKFNEKVNYDMTRFEKVLHFILLLMTAIIFVVTVGYLGTIQKSLTNTYWSLFGPSCRTYVRHHGLGHGLGRAQQSASAMVRRYRKCCLLGTTR